MPDSKIPLRYSASEDAPTTSADPSPVVTSKSGLEQAAKFDDDVYREARRLLEWVEKNKNARREELKWFDSIKNVKREELEWLDSMDNPARKIEQAVRKAEQTNYEGGFYLLSPILQEGSYFPRLEHFAALASVRPNHQHIILERSSTIGEP